MSRKVENIIDYLENPPVVGRIESLDADRVEFDTDKLKEMISALSKKDLVELTGKVEIVCAYWSALRVAPGNDIGTIARYQETKLMIEQKFQGAQNEE